MTVSSSTNKFRYEGNGSTDTFAFTGRIFSAADLKVEIITRATDALVETLTLTTDYTVTINGDESASVQITNALKIPSSLQDVQLRRDLAQTQTVDLPTGTVFPASSVENALDKMAALVQDLSEEVDRCVKISVTSSDDPPSALEVIDAADDAADSAAAAAASAVAAAASAAGVDLPALGAANTVMKVNSGGTELEYGKIAAANIVDGTITPTQADIASQAEAEAGSISTKFMTPQRTAQAIAALTSTDYEYVSSATASTSTSLDFTGLAAGYDYIFVLDALRPATDGVYLWIRTSTNNGSSYDAAASDYEVYTGGEGAQIEGANTIGNAADEFYSGVLTLINPGGTTEKVFTGHSSGKGTTGALNVSLEGGIRKSATAVNAVRFLMSSGNITSGTIRMYRRKTS